MKGRIPTPKHILAMRGSKRARSREELGTPPAAELVPAEWLKPRAKSVFLLVCQWLTKMGTLAESDENVIMRYAIIFSKWEYAEQQLAGIDACYVEVLGPDGQVRFSRSTAMETQSRECHNQLRQLESVLGLTPSDRTRLGYKAEKVVADPMTSLLNRG